VFCRYPVTTTDLLQHHDDMENSHQSNLDLAGQHGLVSSQDLNERGLLTVSFTRLMRKVYSTAWDEAYTQRLTTRYRSMTH